MTESTSARLGRRPEAPVRNRTAAPTLCFAEAGCGRVMNVKSSHEGWWSIPQAMVWIVSRSAPSVETARSFITIASLKQIELRPFSTAEQPPLSLENARIELLRAAGAKEIDISGERGRVREVVPILYGVSNLIDLNGLSECLPCIIEPRQPLQPDSGRHWLRLWISADRCMTRWPGPKATIKHGRPTDTEIVAWYKLRVANHDPQQLPPSREDDVMAAEEHFQTEGIVKMVYAARRKAAPPEWTRSGSKGKKKALAQSGQK
jgi:hypothetical protein